MSQIMKEKYQGIWSRDAGSGANKQSLSLVKQNKQTRTIKKQFKQGISLYEPLVAYDLGWC